MPRKKITTLPDAPAVVPSVEPKVVVPQAEPETANVNARPKPVSRLSRITVKRY